MQITKYKPRAFPSGWGTRTFLMAIINATPDSFSDGGEYSDVPSSLKRVSECIQEGAEIIDIGAQSTRPGASEVSNEIELQRLIPIVKAVRVNFPNILISVDTYSSLVAEKVLSLGVDWINDIRGGRCDNQMFDVIADFKCPYVMTHSRGDSRSMSDLSNYNDVVNEIIDQLKKLTDLCLKKGVDSHNIIWDPGLGFAKNTDQNIEIIKRLEEFKCFNYPLLIGASRKRFLGELLDIENPKERIFGTAAVITRCVQAGIDVVRTHDVKPIKQVVKISESIYK